MLCCGNNVRNALLARHNEVEDTFKTKESLSSVVGYTGKNAEEPKKVDDRSKLV